MKAQLDADTQRKVEAFANRLLGHRRHRAFDFAEMAAVLKEIYVPQVKTILASESVMRKYMELLNEPMHDDSAGAKRRGVQG